MAAKPGGLVPMSITSSTGGTTIVSVPVLPAADYYATVTPAPTSEEPTGTTGTTGATGTTDTTGTPTPAVTTTAG